MHLAGRNWMLAVIIAWRNPPHCQALRILGASLVDPIA